MKIYFSDFFDVSKETLKDYGAFNVSLINDLPLFIDPFLLFNSKDARYRSLHDEIIKYVAFLRDKSASGVVHKGLIRGWFTFPEVRQTWLGYSRRGNAGSGLGPKFAKSLNQNLHTIFANFGNEQVATGSHLEKLCLIDDGVGRDNISDFVTNLIKGYLVEYTEVFAQEHLDASHTAEVAVAKTSFNYDTEVWESRTAKLPFIDGDFVLLAPRNLLTKDETWINKNDLYGEFDGIVESVPNDQLRAHVANYFATRLPRDPSKDDELRAKARTIREFPELLDYYIKWKEDRGDEAIAVSDERVAEIERLFIAQLSAFVDTLQSETSFYEHHGNTLEDARRRVEYLKDVIENKGGHRLFYLDGKPVRREVDLQIMYRLTWYASVSDMSSEVNDGRGPVDYKISRGAGDKTLVEFKLASNSQLRRNLEKQTEIYKAASDAETALRVIMYFSESELAKVRRILKELQLEDDQTIVLIDACRDNKPSGSKA